MWVQPTRLRSHCSCHGHALPGSPSLGLERGRLTNSVNKTHIKSHAKSTQPRVTPPATGRNTGHATRGVGKKPETSAALDTLAPFIQHRARTSPMRLTTIMHGAQARAACVRPRRVDLPCHAGVAGAQRSRTLLRRRPSCGLFEARARHAPRRLGNRRSLRSALSRHVASFFSRHPNVSTDKRTHQP